MKCQVAQGRNIELSLIPLSSFPHPLIYQWVSAILVPKYSSNPTTHHHMAITLIISTALTFCSTYLTLASPPSLQFIVQWYPDNSQHKVKNSYHGLNLSTIFFSFLLLPKFILKKFNVKMHSKTGVIEDIQKQLISSGEHTHCLYLFQGFWYIISSYYHHSNILVAHELPSPHIHQHKIYKGIEPP